MQTTNCCGCDIDDNTLCGDTDEWGCFIMCDDCKKQSEKAEQNFLKTGSWD